MKKFKKWLIRKLGGYTEQIAYAPKKIIQIPDYERYIPIYLNYEMANRELAIIPKKHITTHVKEQLAKCLMNEFDLPIETIENFERCSKTFRTRIFIPEVRL